MTFTPDDAAKGVKQTIISVDSGVTTALDDIIKTWYGVGSLGESANGVLEIRPLDNSAKGGPANDDVNVSLSTVASSRTYNIASNSVAGTLGQFIPAIPFGNFIGRAADAIEANEDPSEVLVRNADPAVGDAHLALALTGVHADHDQLRGR